MDGRIKMDRGMGERWMDGQMADGFVGTYVSMEEWRMDGWMDG